MGFLQFLREAIKHPREVSTVFPSSPFLGRAMADQIDFDRTQTIVELGAGDGALTGPLVKRMTPDAHLHRVEVNIEFCRELR